MLLNLKRKVDRDEEEETDHKGTNASENDESDNEEPRIKDVLEGLSQLVSREKGLRSNTQHGGFQRYLVLDTSRTVTPKPANNTTDEHLRAGRICLTSP